MANSNQRKSNSKSKQKKAEKKLISAVGLASSPRI